MIPCIKRSRKKTSWNQHNRDLPTYFYPCLNNVTDVFSERVAFNMSTVLHHKRYLSRLPCRLWHLEVSSFWYQINNALSFTTLQRSIKAQYTHTHDLFFSPFSHSELDILCFSYINIMSGSALHVGTWT